MDSENNEAQGVQINTALLASGGVLAALGSLLVAVGLLLGGTAFLSAARQWVRQLDRPPGDVAQLKVRQLRSATSAGFEAWKRAQTGA